MAKQVIPAFDEEKQLWTVEMLQTTTPYREIAILFRQKFTEFAPDLDEDTFFKHFKPRLADYVSNKRRKWAGIIAEGREQNKKSIDHVWMSHDNWREEERQEAYEEIKSIAQEMRSTTDADKLSSLKNALDAQKALLNTISNYEKHLLNIEKIEKSGGSGHGITIPETE